MSLVQKLQLENLCTASIYYDGIPDSIIQDFVGVSVVSEGRRDDVTLGKETAQAQERLATAPVRAHHPLSGTINSFHPCS